MVKKQKWGEKLMTKGSKPTKLLESMMRRHHEQGTLKGISNLDLHASRPEFRVYAHQSFTGQVTRIKRALGKFYL